MATIVFNGAKWHFNGKSLCLSQRIPTLLFDSILAVPLSNESMPFSSMQVFPISEKYMH